MKELVLLVEPDGRSEKLRPRLLAKLFINEIIERCDLGGTTWTRLWRNTNEERALSGQRIFREVLAPIVEEKEDPIFQETVIKKPLPLTWKDS